MDQLEKFISENRTAFDDKSPPDFAWDKIEQKTPEKAKRFFLWRGLKVAAAVLLLLATGALIGVSFMNNQYSNRMAAETLSEEFLEIERYYQGEINKKLKTLVSNENFDTSVNDDLQQLDLSIQELKEEIADAPKGSEEQIINTMITNYKTKVDLLERILERVDNNSTMDINKTKKDERIDI